MWEYSDKVREHFFNARNSGPLEEANGIGDVGSIQCGDALRLMLKVEPETEVIQDAHFQTFAVSVNGTATVQITGGTPYVNVTVVGTGSFNVAGGTLAGTGVISSGMTLSSGSVAGTGTLTTQGDKRGHRHN